MSDIIRLLPDSVANQIAAGEVIQRPASVVKELVENSVDAGASAVTVILKDAGRTLIQVVDDGSGMSDTDARMAFERHATSKITQAADLFDLHTMGFRGEALASIAAIAQLDVRTMLKGQSVGTRLVINGSTVESQTPEACAPGTNIMVKNLFFNVPARRKFLKKDTIELNNVLREFERLALVNPSIDLTLIHNDSTLHALRKAPLLKRISDLFGRALESQLVPVQTETSLVSISGFTGLPEHARRRNPLQYLFVNGRNMKHPYFHKALMSCYEQLLPPDMQPNYFVNFTVDPQSIDVNIHPTKNEIKFENEQAIWQILVAAVRESLGRFNAVPSIEFDRSGAVDIPTFNPNASALPTDGADPDYNPFATPSAARTALAGAASRTPHREALQDWDKLYANFSHGSPTDPTNDPDNPVSRPPVTVAMQGELDLDFNTVSPSLMQLNNRYILTPARNGLMVIDQHRAHKLILFERNMTRSEGGSVSTQKVMFAEMLRLSAAQNAVMETIADEITRMGFDLSFLGDNTWSINGAPPALSESGSADMLLRMIDNVMADAPSATNVAADLRRRVALAMASMSAVRTGQPLNQGEIERLTSDLFSLPNPAYTPDGQRVFTLIDLDDISHRLG